MRTIGTLTCAVCLTLSGAGFVRADDQAELKALVDKAIKVTGGEEKLAKYKAATWKAKGTFHGMGMAIPFTGDWAVQWPDQFRVAIVIEIDNMKFTFATVLSGDKGWRKLQDDVQELDKEQLADQKEERHAAYLTTLLPLKSKDVTLSSLGESKVNDKPALGIKVAQKGYRDVNLFFDKASHLLVKTESRVKDDMTGQEVNQEAFYSDYKEAEGIKHPTKVVLKREGKVFVEAESSEYKVMEKLDRKVFDKP
jgi:hypothetical protein